MKIFGTLMGKTFEPKLAKLLDLDQQAMEGFRIRPSLFLSIASSSYRTRDNGH